MKRNRLAMTLAILPFLGALSVVPAALAHDDHETLHNELNTEHSTMHRVLNAGHRTLSAEHGAVHDELNAEHQDFHESSH